MLKMKRILLISTALIFSHHSFAMTKIPMELSMDYGVFAASMDNVYNDQTDLIAQNISVTSPQHGYVGGFALNANCMNHGIYILDAQLSAQWMSGSSSFQSGASSTAFSDNLKLTNNIDLTLMPGIWLISGTSIYIKAGISFANTNDKLISPVGFTPTMTTYNQNQTVIGFAGGLGLKKSISEKWSLFIEGNYHDYGTVNFNNFQNFSATYSHTSHLYSMDTVMGATYKI